MAFLKQLLRILLYLLTWPGSVFSFLSAFLVAYILAVVAKINDCRGRYVDLSNAVAYVPLKWGEILRYYFYCFTLEYIGNKVVFKFGSACCYRKTRIGNNVLIGFHTVLGEVKIGNDVLIGSYVLFLSGNKQHSFDDPKKKICDQPGRREMVIVGDDVWVGSKSTIMANIGNRCIIAAGSVVTKPVGDYTIVGGNPASFIRSICQKEENV